MSLNNHGDSSTEKICFYIIYAGMKIHPKINFAGLNSKAFHGNLANGIKKKQGRNLTDSLLWSTVFLEIVLKAP